MGGAGDAGGEPDPGAVCAGKAFGGAAAGGVFARYYGNGEFGFGVAGRGGGGEFVRQQSAEYAG